MQVDRGDDVDGEEQAAISEHPLDPLERQEPDEQNDRRGPDQQKPAEGHVREVELQDQGDPAHLGRDGEDVDRLAGEQRDKAWAEPQPLPDHVEDRPLGDRRDPAAHLRVRGDPDHADRDGPEQLVAEQAAGLGVEDELADVDEAAEGGDHSEGDLEDLLHSDSSTLLAWSLRSDRPRVTFVAGSGSAGSPWSASSNSAARFPIWLPRIAACCRPDSVGVSAKASAEFRDCLASSAVRISMKSAGARERAASLATSIPSAVDDCSVLSSVETASLSSRPQPLADTRTAVASTIRATRPITSGLPRDMVRRAYPCRAALKPRQSALPPRRRIARRSWSLPIFERPAMPSRAASRLSWSRVFAWPLRTL